MRARPDVADPLAARSHVPRVLRRLRLKEWEGFTLLHPEMSCSMILQDAHYLASSEIYVRDEAGLVEHSRTVRGGGLSLPPRLFPSAPRIDVPDYRIAFDWADRPSGTHRVAVDVAATHAQPAITISLELDGARASAPLSVSAPIPGGSIYTHKVAFPASGEVSVGERRHTFDPARDLALLDEHRTFLPYRTRWLWGTFAGQTAEGIVGANFARRPTTPGSEEESCLWTSRGCEPLADVAFTPADPSDPLRPWRIRSADGRLDVTFSPEERKAVKHQLVLAAIDYWQLVGTYDGTVAGRPVTGMRGVCESMRARL